MTDPASSDPIFTKGDETEHYSGYVIRVTNTAFVGPDGEEFTRDVVHSPGAVAAVPVHAFDGDNPMVTMVRQYRAPIEDWLYEIPAGLRDKPGEPTEETCHRELAEEVGLKAATLQLVSAMWPAAGMTNQRTWIYLATGLTQTDTDFDGVEEEHMTVVTIPLDEAVDKVMAGEISDGKTVIGLLAVARLLGR